MNLHNIPIDKIDLLIRYMHWRYDRYEFRRVADRPHVVEHRHRGEQNFTFLYDQNGHMRAMDAAIAQGTWTP